MKRRMPREAPMLLLIVLISIGLCIFVPTFKTRDNLTAVGENAAFVGIMACGEAVVILGAGIDLSVGSVMAVSSCAMAMMLASGVPWAATALVGLVIGAIAGLLNGLLITMRKLPPILTTLATLLLFRHGISIASHDKAFGPFPDSFNLIGAGWTPAIVFTIAAVLAYIAMEFSRFGRWNLAMGGSESAAELSGLPVNQIRCGTYVLSGLCAALAGWIVMAFNNNAQSSVGKGYELDAIAACVVGGIRITGGDGSVLGAALGAILISMLRDLLTLTGRPENQAGLFTGAVILVAALLEGFRMRRARLRAADTAH